jgi:hypothetical protein
MHNRGRRLLLASVWCKQQHGSVHCCPIVLWLVVVRDDHESRARI